MGTDVYGLRKAVTKQIDLTIDQYNGEARDGDLVIDTNPGATQYQLFVGTETGNLVSVVGGGGDANYANFAGNLYSNTTRVDVNVDADGTNQRWRFYAEHGGYFETPTGGQYAKSTNYVYPGINSVILHNLVATLVVDVGTSTMGLSLSTVAGVTVPSVISGFYSKSGNVMGSDAVVQTLTTTPSSVLFGWNLNGVGDSATYTLTDGNGRIYRITYLTLYATSPSYTATITIEQL